MANWNCWMDGYMYMNTPDKYPLQTYLATILMESKNNVETLMTPEQLIRMAKVSEKPSKPRRSSWLHCPSCACIPSFRSITQRVSWLAA